MSSTVITTPPGSRQRDADDRLNSNTSTNNRNSKWPSLLLMLSVMLVVLPCMSVAQHYKVTEAPSQSPFLNYGQKKIKPGPEIENEIIKSKVEVLGEILKRHVHALRQVRIRICPVQMIN